MRKYTSFLVCGIASFLIGSCRNVPKESRLTERIEYLWALSDSNLKAATEGSRRLKDSIAEAPEYARKKFDLLTIRLRHKNYQDPTCDDSIKGLVAYFDCHGTETDRMRAYYYLAATYDGLHDSPRAVENALKATSMAENGNDKDTAMWLKCYSMLSDLYRQQKNYQEAIEMALKGLGIAQESNKVDSWYIMDVASSYFLARDTLNGIKYADQAYQVFEKESDNKNLIATDLLRLYSIIGSSKADTLYQTLRDAPKNFLSESAFGQYFKCKNETDSAILHFEKHLQISTDAKRKLSASSELVALYYRKGDRENALRYALEYREANHKLQEEQQTEWTKNARGIFHYMRDKEAEARITERADRMRMALVIAIGALVILSLAATTIYNREKKKALETIVGKDLKLKEARERIRQKNRELQEKTADLEEAESQYREIQQALDRKTRQNRELMRQALLDHMENNAEEIIASFKKASQGHKKLTANDWKELMSAIETLYPGFNEEMASKLSNPKSFLLRTCYLMKAGLSNSEIEHIMNVPHQTVWYRVKKIKAAMGDSISPEGS
ncbi:MAG: hypothetical protein J5661_05915 [Bacteroidaceae bacterium]|nr:hypothetical protein [Bacteroidaceae bacterium]